jgi:hypothetical protein
VGGSPTPATIRISYGKLELIGSWTLAIVQYSNNFKKVQKPINSECYTPSSEPIRIYMANYFLGFKLKMAEEGLADDTCPPLLISFNSM